MFRVCALAFLGIASFRSCLQWSPAPPRGARATAEGRRGFPRAQPVTKISTNVPFEGLLEPRWLFDFLKCIFSIGLEIEVLEMLHSELQV